MFFSKTVTYLTPKIGDFFLFIQKWEKEMKEKVLYIFDSSKFYRYFASIFFCQIWQDLTYYSRYCLSRKTETNGHTIFWIRSMACIKLWEPWQGRYQTQILRKNQFHFRKIFENYVVSLILATLFLYLPVIIH